MFPTSILQGTYGTTDIPDPYNGLTPFYVQDNGSGSVLRQTVSGPYAYCIPEYGMTIELYHDGSGALPAVGDKVYTYPDPQSYNIFSGYSFQYLMATVDGKNGNYSEGSFKMNDGTTLVSQVSFSCSLVGIWNFQNPNGIAVDVTYTEEDGTVTTVTVPGNSTHTSPCIRDNTFTDMQYTFNITRISDCP